MKKVFTNTFLSACCVAILLIFFFSISVDAQQKKTKRNEITIVVKARDQEQRILLRWGVNDAAAWRIANKYGYIVERYTLLKNGNLTQTTKKINITPIPLKPKPEKDWINIVQKNDDAAIIAQSLYGASFQINSGQSGITSIINQSKELDQRYAFALLAADRSFEAAQMAGWGLVDSTVKKGEKYLYRIYTAVPAAIIKIDTAGVFIGIEEFKPLPKPKDLYAVFGDKAVMITWNYKLLKDIYSTYYIERSEDGINFKKLSDLPVVNLNENDANTPSKMFYSDTLLVNNKNYTYRIKGLTCFGEMGPSSEVVSGAGKSLLTYVPNISIATIINDTTVTIEWEFAMEGMPLLDHFELNQSIDSKDNSFKIVIENIPVQAREFTFNKLLPTNYFTITAIDKNGNKRTSFPYLVQPVDSTPPAIPINLSVVIDTIGNVTLKWKANEEADFLGYTILKGNLQTEEAAVINSKPYLKNIFKEKINLKTLNPKVYYSVIAVDKRMNQSKPSVIVELIKPDKIPPTTPIFIDYSLTDEGNVALHWINSSSQDVAIHRLYRKEINQINWQPVKEFEGATVVTYVDETVKNGQTMAYTLVAIDKSSNESQPSPPLTVTVINTQKIPAVKNLKATVDKAAKNILLSWNFKEEDLIEYTIYKGLNKAPLTTWMVVDAKQTSISDRDITINNVYRYAVRAILKDGRMSEWKEIKIEY